MPESNRPDQNPAGAHSWDPAGLTAQVIGLLEPELNRDGLELLDVRVFRGGGRFQVRIYVDLPEGGITLDQCTRAARTVSMLMEESDPFPGAYVLEVSSPGIRRPLRKLEHFQAVVGQKVEIKVRHQDVPARVRGVLEGVEEEGVLVVLPAGQAGAEEAPQALRFPVSAVVEANLDPEFDAQAIINADRRRRKEERREERQARKSKGRKGRPKAPKNKDRDGEDIEPGIPAGDGPDTGDSDPAEDV